MNLKTNFNPSHEAKLKSLIGKELVSIIFFKTKPHVFASNFPLKDFYGERVALVFRMSLLNLDHIPIRKRHKIPKQRQYKIFSVKCNNFNEDNYIMGDLGAPIWNLDFHFDTFTRKQNYGFFPKVIDGVELIRGSYVVFSNVHQSARKIEIFGMREYFENIENVDFESMSSPYPRHKAFENYEYPIDVNITMGIIVSLSEGSYLLIQNGTRNGVRMHFFNEQEIQKIYQKMKGWKNIFNRPFHKLIYTTDS